MKDLYNKESKEFANSLKAYLDNTLNEEERDITERMLIAEVNNTVMIQHHKDWRVVHYTPISLVLSQEDLSEVLPIEELTPEKVQFIIDILIY